MTKVLKPYDVTRQEVDAAWKAVRQAGGGAGYDGKSISDIKIDEDNYLYKTWNRLASGSYQADCVLHVPIPKAKGGMRTLGIPTVVDRIAQGVVKERLNKDVQHLFHPNSYAYQDGKSALDALGVTRERCMRGPYKWVVDIDIKSFFDELDHDLMMEIVSKYTKDKFVLIYCKKFLKAKGVTQDGEEVVRTKGTPQGGVVSPVLSNLFLHEAFDMWMKDKYPNIPFERYADDIIVHCVSEKQAYFIKDMIEKRLKQFKLSLNLEKTKVVYAGTDDKHDHRGHKCPRSFDFLGYKFKPRRYNGRIVFTPGISQRALFLIRNKIRELKLTRRVGQGILDIAELLNPKMRGWINYYGKFRKSDLYRLADYANDRLSKWLKRKHKSILTQPQGWKKLKEIQKKYPKMFCHWYMIGQSSTRAV